MKTVHFYHGCPWADGSIQMSDTNQKFFWEEVTCLKCLSTKYKDPKTGMYFSSRWREDDRERFLQTLDYLTDREPNMIANLDDIAERVTEIRRKAANDPYKIGLENNIEYLTKIILQLIRELKKR